MAFRRWTVLLLGLLACQREAGVYVQFIAATDVPALDRIHVMVLQNGELLTESREDLPIAGLALPQNVLLVSQTPSDAPVDIIAQGFSGELVQARGAVSARLGRERPYDEVTLVLVRPCTDASCMLKPTTCNAQSATCGAVDDLAGGFLNCGVCPSPQTCGGGGTHRCGTSVCTPSVTCASASASCGEVFDGCKVISCGACTAPAACTLAHACACSPTRSCTGNDGGCGMVDDGCGHTLQCGRCGCVPDCTSAACGADDGCGGMCMHGSCPSGACVGGACGCSAPLTVCPGGGCRDLTTDPSNCGSCGHVCTGTHACAGGQCVCQSPSDNADGHCCPSGYSFELSAEGKGPYCYAEPGFAASIDLAEAFCTNNNSGACVGFGGASPALAVPASAGCGSYLAGRGPIGSMNPYKSTVSTFAESETFLGSAACEPCDGGSSCTCSTCSCMTVADDCTQRFYCVTDPLAPRRAMCLGDDDCPAGTTCTAGACVSDPTFGCCVGAVFCNSPVQGTCSGSGSRATGQCR